MQAPAAVGDSLIGGILGGKYRVLKQIGRGGMGVVYEAEHLGLGKHVAVKLMLEKYTDDSEAVARFRREALAAGRIGDPHIIEIFDLGQAPDGRSFVVMELLNGFPLSKVLEMGGAMPTWRALQIMRQVLRAVGAAHAKGIIHRDLKPDNIFLIHQSEDHDFVKLLDFGISKVLSLEEHATLTKLTTTGAVMGTPLYMAPEQALGNRVERSADIYACGVILYEMLSGRPPFQGPTYAALMAKLLTEPPPPLQELRPGLPSSLVRAVHRALEKEPHARFESAEKFAAALPAVGTPDSRELELAGTLDSRGGAAAIPTPERPGRFRNVKIAVAAFTLASAATAATLIVTDDGGPAPMQAASALPAQEPAERTAPPATAPAAATPATVARAPAARTGTLEVKSTPSGAAVIVDGTRSGTTPVVVTLAPGRHQVRLELEGHAAVTTDEDVRADARSYLEVPLAAAAPPPKGAAKTVVRPARRPAAEPLRARPTPPADDEPQLKPFPSSSSPAPPPPAPADEPKPRTAPADDVRGSAPRTRPNPYTK